MRVFAVLDDPFGEKKEGSALARNANYLSYRDCCIVWEEENQIDATQCFIELIICSTCFGHVYAHHQELATILLVWHVACNSWLLVVGRSGAGQQAMRPE